MIEKFLQLINNINPQIQESHWTPRRINTKKTAPRHIRVKMLKTEDKADLKNIQKGKKHFREIMIKNDG